MEGMSLSSNQDVKPEEIRQDQEYGIAGKLWAGTKKSSKQKQKRVNPKFKNPNAEKKRKETNVGDKESSLKIGEVFSLPLESYLQQNSSKKPIESVEEMLDAKGKTVYRSQVKCKPSSVVVEQVDIYLKGKTSVSFKTVHQKLAKCDKRCRLKRIQEMSKVSGYYVSSTGRYRFPVNKNAVKYGYTVTKNLGKHKTQTFYKERAYKFHPFVPRDEKSPISDKQVSNSNCPPKETEIKQATDLDTQFSLGTLNRYKRVMPKKGNGRNEKDVVLPDTETYRSPKLVGTAANKSHIMNTVPEKTLQNPVSCQVPLPDINNVTVSKASTSSLPITMAVPVSVPVSRTTPVFSSALTNTVTATKGVVDPSSQNQSQYLLINVDGKNILVPTKLDETNPKAYIVNESNGTVIPRPAQPIVLSFQPEKSVTSQNIIKHISADLSSTIAKTQAPIPSGVLNTPTSTQIPQLSWIQQPNPVGQPPVLQSGGIQQQKTTANQSYLLTGNAQQPPAIVPTVVANQSAFVFPQGFGSQIPVATTQSSTKQVNSGITVPMLMQPVNSPAPNPGTLQTSFNYSIPNFVQQPVLMQQQTGNKIASGSPALQTNLSNVPSLVPGSLNSSAGFVLSNIAQGIKHVSENIKIGSVSENTKTGSTAENKSASGKVVADNQQPVTLNWSFRPNTATATVATVTNTNSGIAFANSNTGIGTGNVSSNPIFGGNATFLTGNVPAIPTSTIGSTIPGNVSAGSKTLGQIVRDSNGNCFLVQAINTPVSPQIPGGQLPGGQIPGGQLPGSQLQTQPAKVTGTNLSQGVISMPQSNVSVLTGGLIGSSAGTGQFQVLNTNLLPTNRGVNNADNMDGKNAVAKSRKHSATVKDTLKRKMKLKSSSLREKSSPFFQRQSGAENNISNMQPQALGNSTALNKSIPTMFVPIEQSSSVQNSTTRTLPKSSTGTLSAQTLLTLQSNTVSGQNQIVPSQAFVKNSTQSGTLIYAPNPSMNNNFDRGSVVGSFAGVSASGQTFQPISIGAPPTAAVTNSSGQRHTLNVQQTTPVFSKPNNLNSSIPGYPISIGIGNTNQLVTTNNQTFISPTHYAPVFMNSISDPIPTASIEKQPKVNKRKSRPPVRKDFDDVEIEDNESMDQDYSIFVVPDTPGTSPIPFQFSKTKFSSDSTIEEKSVTIPDCLKCPVAPPVDIETI